MARIWPWELAARIAAGVSAVVRKVQKEMLHSAFITAYPSERAVERPRTQAARDVARAARGSCDSSDADWETMANVDIIHVTRND